MTPSHTITDDGDKVTVHSVELFCGWNPDFDGPHDPDISAYTPAKVQEIVKRTKTHMTHGEYPQLIVQHDGNGKAVKPESVGRIKTCWYEDRSGVPYILGDIEMSATNFQTYLASNQFPRRSAEIWEETNHLSEVALLGRETPRRPLPDTVFTRKGTKVLCEQPAAVSFIGVGGGSNTYIPDTDRGNRSNAMPDNDGYEDRLNNLEAMMKKMSKKMGIEDEDKEVDLAEEEDTFDEKPRPMIDDEDEDNFDLDNDDPQIAMLHARIADLDSQVRKSRFEKILAEMTSEGYRIGKNEKALMAQLEQSVNPDETVRVWKSCFKRDPVGIRFDSRNLAMPYNESLTQSDISALVREHAGNPEAFRKAINSRIRKA